MNNILQDIEKIKPFPIITTKLIKLLKNTDTSIEELTQTIKQDQVITAQLLKAANSLVYGGVSEITTIPNAIMRLGYDNVISLLLYLYTGNLYKKAGKYQIEDKGLWKHSIATAIMSECIVEYKKLPIDIEKIFVIGLLHDIGKIILSQYIEDKIEEINYHVAKENLLFYEAEKKILGFNHAEVGSMLLNKWKIPKDIINTVKYHHNPYENKESNTLYTKVVYLADILVNSLAIGIGYDCKKFIMNSLILDELNIKTEEINDIIEQFIIKIDLINLLDFV